MENQRAGILFPWEILQSAESSEIARTLQKVSDTETVSPPLEDAVSLRLT